MNEDTVLVILEMVLSNQLFYFKGRQACGSADQPQSSTSRILPSFNVRLFLVPPINRHSTCYAKVNWQLSEGILKLLGRYIRVNLPAKLHMKSLSQSKLQPSR